MVEAARHRALTTCQEANAGNSFGAQSSAVPSNRIAAVGMTTSPGFEFRIRLPHDPTRMKIRAPLRTASGKTIASDGPPIPDVVTETVVPRYSPVYDTRPRCA